MALVKETGTGTEPTANTYAEAAELVEYAQLRGVDLSGESTEALEVLLVKAMDFLEGKGSRFKGYKTSESQPLQWPRFDVWGVSRPGSLFPSNQIPRELVYAQLAAALEARDADLQPNRGTNQSGPVVEKRVEGAVTVKYAAPVSQHYTPAFAKVEALLAPLLENRGLELVRV